jgi:WD40 repeat protein
VLSFSTAGGVPGQGQMDKMLFFSAGNDLCIRCWANDKGGGDIDSSDEYSSEEGDIKGGINKASQKWSTEGSDYNQKDPVTALTVIQDPNSNAKAYVLAGSSDGYVRVWVFSPSRSSTPKPFFEDGYAHNCKQGKITQIHAFVHGANNDLWMATGGMGGGGIQFRVFTKKLENDKYIKKFGQSPVISFGQYLTGANMRFATAQKEPSSNVIVIYDFPSGKVYHKIILNQEVTGIEYDQSSNGLVVAERNNINIHFDKLKVDRCQKITNTIKAMKVVMCYKRNMPFLVVATAVYNRNSQIQIFNFQDQKAEAILSLGSR